MLKSYSPLKELHLKQYKLEVSVKNGCHKRKQRKSGSQVTSSGSIQFSWRVPYGLVVACRIRLFRTRLKILLYCRQYNLSLIREKYWIIKARSLLHRIISSCVDCRKRQAAVGQQKMASFPADRVMPFRSPFSYVGVDCFGPMEVRTLQLHAALSVSF